MPPFLITPPLAWRCKESEFGMPVDAILFTGDEGLDFDCGAINGLVVSNAAVDDLDFIGAPKREDRLVGEEAREILLIPDNIEGVRGVFASERER